MKNLLLVAFLPSVLFPLSFPGFSSVKGKDLNQSTLEAVASSDLEFQELAVSVKPSIALIESVDRTCREGGRGTGVVVGEKGLIATNFHVIGDHRDFVVRFADGSSYKPSSIVAVDRARDLALFRIEDKESPPLLLGDSNSLNPGETILSIGNPLGYSFSVSRGVVAAVRELELGDGRPMIQVAVPIEPGSSGSPVIDLNGRVVAVLSIKSGGAMGFGVPVNDLKILLQEEQKPIPFEKWLTIGALDKFVWKPMMEGSWKQRAGELRAVGFGKGFGGRMLCHRQKGFIKAPFEIEAEVRLEDDGGAAGLVFCSNEKGEHYGFYPTNGSLRLTRFDGPSVYNWKILKTVESEYYRPEEWNRIHVKFQENGRILCSVNNQLVIDVIDLEMSAGIVGLCKFREPTAFFRNFRFAERFSNLQISPKSVAQVRKLTKGLSHEKSLSAENMQELLKIGKTAPQILQDLSTELSRRAAEVEKLAEEVRERLVISELVDSLSFEDEKSIDLLKAALLIARLDNKHFDLDSYLQKADAIAERIGSTFPQNADGGERIRILVQQLFVEMGFHGSTLDFYHRSNSYMNEVMDDREGLPITLSVLFIELAKRLDLEVSGLGLPGRFLALYEEPNPSTRSPKDKARKSSKKEIIIDAFGGKIIDRAAAAELTGIALEDLEFQPSNKKEIIRRMLRNLLQAAEQEDDQTSQIRYLDTLLAISPEDRYSRAQRAMIAYLLGDFERALADIDFLLESNPQSSENEPLRVIRNRLINQGSSAF